MIPLAKTSFDFCRAIFVRYSFVILGNKDTESSRGFKNFNAFLEVARTSCYHSSSHAEKNSWHNMKQSFTHKNKV